MKPQFNDSYLKNKKSLQDLFIILRNFTLKSFSETWGSKGTPSNDQFSQTYSNINSLRGQFLAQQLQKVKIEVERLFIMVQMEQENHFINNLKNRMRSRNFHCFKLF
ncbi:unnamed protein product (macronuclear) [Paramecium tetraurelia]|uniref:Uncharacterized protein n=1 Tax=Paramecium tetraurelia TaxID=5888 RepID=A0D4K2_PARTE|nr:uncharacterized protein GSPATT00039246001 [Paramecium tetraurelia]CAK77969.1 unnamed protein product [Paramecium tetraurelia]|eukprot:XP_001445366.1 hypothetical protein (macronuclear) [Paramecium tetraurelia strain d4-2]